MPGVTPNVNYPYPEGPDPISVHTDIQALAEAVDEIWTTTTGFVARSGWSLTGQFGARWGPLGFISVAVTRTGAPITVTTDGDFANQQVADAPAQLTGPLSLGLQPLQSNGGGRVATGSYQTLLGIIALAAVGGTANIATGDPITLSGLVLLGSPLP